MRNVERTSLSSGTLHSLRLAVWGIVGRSMLARLTWTGESELLLHPRFQGSGIR